MPNKLDLLGNRLLVIEYDKLLPNDPTLRDRVENYRSEIQGIACFSNDVGFHEDIHRALTSDKYEIGDRERLAIAAKVPAVKLNAIVGEPIGTIIISHPAIDYIDSVGYEVWSAHWDEEAMLTVIDIVKSG